MTLSCVACTCAERGAYLFWVIYKRNFNKQSSCSRYHRSGDSFAAGFLYGLSKNFTFEKCAALGNVIAGEVLKVYGPRVEKSLKNLDIVTNYSLLIV